MKPYDYLESFPSKLFDIDINKKKFFIDASSMRSTTTPMKGYLLIGGRRVPAFQIVSHKTGKKEFFYLHESVENSFEREKLYDVFRPTNPKLSGWEVIVFNT